MYHTSTYRKKFAVIFSTIIFLLLPSGLFASTADELRARIQAREAEIKKIEAEIAQYQNALDTQTGVSKNLKSEIQKLETQIKKINADIKLTEYEIQNTELKISALGIEIRQKESTISEGKATLAELIRTVNESDEISLVEALFGYESVGDFFNEQDAVVSLHGAVEDKLTTLQKEKENLSSQQSAHEAEEQNLQNFKKNLTGKKSVQESITQSKSTLLKDSKNQEARYQKLLKDRAKQRESIQNELHGIEAELQALIDRSTLPSKGSGVLSWPIGNPFITQGFGLTDFATTYGSDIYHGNGHNGVDFRASIGTPLLAAADGTVKATGNTDTICSGGSYGKWIVIEHANNLSTLYGHLSSIQVTAGQKVSRGSVIGYSGDTGYVTGPHLHFTVYATNTYRLSKTIHCGLIPAGGYLNPMDYL